MKFHFGTWLRAMSHIAASGPRARRGAKRTRRVVLGLEALEDRTVPSTLTVTSPADDGSAGTLRAVITAAQSGDTVNFDPSLAGQTITLTGGELAIAKSLDIAGPGTALLTVSGNKAGRVFAFNEAEGGAAGAGGTAGQGVGGGLYLTPGGVACADLWTIIAANHASTSDDVFGLLGVC